MINTQHTPCAHFHIVILPCAYLPTVLGFGLFIFLVRCPLLKRAPLSSLFSLPLTTHRSLKQWVGSKNLKNVHLWVVVKRPMGIFNYRIRHNNHHTNRLHRNVIIPKALQLPMEQITMSQTPLQLQLLESLYIPLPAFQILRMTCQEHLKEQINDI